jgi:hypothetical protein
MPHPPAGPASLLASLPAHLGRPLNPPEAVVLGWSDTDHDHAVVVSLRLTSDDPLDELELARAVVVVGDRWRSIACVDPTCCPPEGSPMPHAVTGDNR